tara:strand:- start:179 stop:634 length:456 start_codon:yes stop_codon:yes gene_type:complete
MGESAYTDKLVWGVHAQLGHRVDLQCQTKIRDIELTKTEILGVRVQALLAPSKKLRGCHSLFEVGVFALLHERVFGGRCMEEVLVATYRRQLAGLDSNMIEQVLGEASKSNLDVIVHFLTEGVRKASRRVLREGWEKLDASVRNTFLASAV